MLENVVVFRKLSILNLHLIGEYLIYFYSLNKCSWLLYHLALRLPRSDQVRTDGGSCSYCTTVPSSARLKRCRFTWNKSWFSWRTKLIQELPRIITSNRIYNSLLLFVVFVSMHNHEVIIIIIRGLACAPYDLIKWSPYIAFSSKYYCRYFLSVRRTNFLHFLVKPFIVSFKNKN